MRFMKGAPFRFGINDNAVAMFSDMQQFHAGPDKVTKATQRILVDLHSVIFEAENDARSFSL